MRLRITAEPVAYKRTWDELPPFKLRDEEVSSVGLTRDGTAILGLASDKNGSRKIYVWDSNSGVIEQTIAGSAKHASQIAVSPDNETLAGFTYDGRILIWEFRTGYIKRIFGDYKAYEISALEFSPDGKVLAVSSTRKEQSAITLWDVREGTLKLVIPNDHRVGIVRFSPDGSTLAGAGSDEKVKLWSVRGLER